MSSWRTRWLMPRFAAGVGLLALPNCLVVEGGGYSYYDGTTDSGDLTLYYSFDGADCYDAGADTIIVDLGLPSGGLETFSTDCFTSPAGFTITNLRPGTYDVWVSAYSDTGVMYYESTGWQVVQVMGGAANAYDVTVPVTLGNLSLSWTFVGDPRCLDVYEVWVTVEDPFGVIYDNAYYDCAAGGVSYNSVVSGDWYVWMDALSVTGDPLYISEGLVQVLPYTTNTFVMELN